MRAATCALSLLVVLIGMVLAGCGKGDPDPCEGACGSRECGTVEVEEEGVIECPCGSCTEPETCDPNGVCVQDPCPEPLHVMASGTTLNPVGGAQPTPVSVAVSPISPMDALMNPSPTHLYDTESDANGHFTTGCFDVTDVALGLVILADDKGWDGAGGTYFPTGTGVKAWNMNSEKVDVSGATVFALPNTLVAALGQIPGFDAAGEGFVMGMVLDHAGSPIAGATVQKDDGTPVGALYPSLAFDDFSGASTAAHGAFLIPGLDVSPSTVRAAAAGHTFDDEQVGTKGGFCFFAMLQANE